VVLCLAAAGPGCGGNDASSPTTAVLRLHEGALAPGLYEVQTFGPGVAFRIGDGWATHHTDPRFFDLHRTPAGGPAPGTPGWEVALLFLQPEADGIDAFVRGMRQRSNDVRVQEPTTLGALEATLIEVTQSDGDADLFEFEGGTVGGFPARRYRIWAMETGGDLLTVVLDGPENGSPDLPLAEEVLASIRFRTGGTGTEGE
jgi:hypothetical protein